MTFPLTHGFSI
jgi:hypothetical protein